MQRKLGEKLIEAKRAGQIAEGRPKAGNPQTNGGFPRVTLEDAGINYNLSSRAQKKSQGIAPQAFDAMLERLRDNVVAGKRFDVLAAVTAQDKAERRAERKQEIGQAASPPAIWRCRRRATA